MEELQQYIMEELECLDQRVIDNAEFYCHIN